MPARNKAHCGAAYPNAGQAGLLQNGGETPYQMIPETANTLLRKSLPRRALPRGGLPDQAGQVEQFREACIEGANLGHKGLVDVHHAIDTFVLD